MKEENTGTGSSSSREWWDQLQAIAEILSELSRLGRNFEMPQQRLEFRPAGRTLRRWVGHTERFVL